MYGSRASVSLDTLEPRSYMSAAYQLSVSGPSTPASDPNQDCYIRQTNDPSEFVQGVAHPNDLASAEQLLVQNIEGHVHLAPGTPDVNLDFYAPSDVSSADGSPLKIVNVTYDPVTDTYSGGIAIENLDSDGNPDGTYGDPLWGFTESPAKLLAGTVGSFDQITAYDHNDDQLLATFSDPLNSGSYHATMNWGDGKSDDATVQLYAIDGVQQYDGDNNPLYAVMGHHNFDYPGDYTGHLDVTRDIGDDQDALHIDELKGKSDVAKADTYGETTAAVKQDPNKRVVSAVVFTTGQTGKVGVSAQLKDPTTGNVITKGLEGLTWNVDTTGLPGITGFAVGTSGAMTSDANGWVDTSLSWTANATGTVRLILKDKSGDTITTILVKVK